jgi:tellurite resistance protein
VTRLKELPIGAYGAVMGIVGLGLTARAAAPLFPGVVRAPAYVTEPIVLLGVLVFIGLVLSYAVKLFRYPAAVRDEFVNPATLGFCAALPVGMTLVAGGIAPYAPALGSVVWWSGAVLLFAMQVWGVVRVLQGGIELGQVNAGWMILFIGGIVVPGGGLALGHVEAARFLYGLSAAATPFVMGLVFYRAVIGPALPEVLRPTWFILLVPPSLIYAHGLVLYPGLAFLDNLLFFGLLLAAGLLVYARGFARWRFGVPWWAFTFPLDAFAYAAARHAQEHSSQPWRVVAALALLLAAFFVLMCLWKTLRSAASRPA